MVRYPSAISFTSLLADRKFQLTSVLRELAVMRFSFGLSEAPVASFSPWDIEDNNRYLVHHWTGSETGSDDTIELVKEAARDTGAEVAFDASIAYTLRFEKSDSDHTSVPCLMDRLVMLRHKQLPALRDCFNHKLFQDAIKQTDTSFVGLVERVS